MLSLDVEERFRRNTLKWFIYGGLSLLIALVIIFVEKTPDVNTGILTIFIILLIFSLIVFLIGIYNLSIWLKIRNVIKIYHNGDYQKAKQLAVRAYKMSNSKELKDLINYLDSQIIDDIVSEQERLENPDAEDDEMLHDINEQIEEVEKRIKKLVKIRQEITHKMLEVKQRKAENKEVEKQFSNIIEQYSQLLEFSDLRVHSYQQILKKLRSLKQRHKKISQLWEDKEDLKDLLQELLSEGYRNDDEVEVLEQFFRNERSFLEYIKEFLASSNLIEDAQEFERLYTEFMEKLEELEKHQRS